MNTYWLESRTGEPADLPAPRVGAAEEGSFRRPATTAAPDPPVPAKAPSPQPPTPAPAPKAAPAPAPAPAPTPKPAPAPAPAPARQPSPPQPAPAPAPAPANHAPAPANHAPAPVANGVNHTSVPAGNNVGVNNSHTPVSAFLLDGHGMNNINPDRAIMKMHRSRLCIIL